MERNNIEMSLVTRWSSLKPHPPLRNSDNQDPKGGLVRDIFQQLLTPGDPTLMGFGPGYYFSVSSDFSLSRSMLDWIFSDARNNLNPDVVAWCL